MRLARVLLCVPVVVPASQQDTPVLNPIYPPLVTGSLELGDTVVPMYVDQSRDALDDNQTVIGGLTKVCSPAPSAVKVAARFRICDT